MSCLYMHKKLKKLPSSSKKDWKSFTSSVSPKLRNLHKHLNKLPKSITKTTNRLLGLRRHNPRPFSGRAHQTGRIYYNQYQQYHHIQQSGPNSPATVYIDQLFGHMEASTSCASANISSTSCNNVSCDNRGVKRRTEKARDRSKDNDMATPGDMKWKEYVSSMPYIRGVDERAEDFISKFRHEMQLQREQSILDFHEMLARST